MSRGINKWYGIGNCCADPVTKYLPDGRAVTDISLATNESYKDKAGFKQDRAEFHRIVFFGKLAELAGEYLKRGSKVYLSGSLRTRKWEKDGQTHYTTEIVAKEMQLLDRKEAEKPAEVGFSDMDDFDRVPF